MNQFANICLKILHLYLCRMLLLFSCPVMSNSLWPKWLQYARPICPSHLPKFAQVHVHCISDAAQPSHPLTPLLFLPSIFPSIRDFSSESAVLIRWSKYLSFSFSFSFSISPSDEYSGLISLKIDWFDRFAVQGTLRSLLQHLSSKALILPQAAFFMVCLSQLFMTTGKTTLLLLLSHFSRVRLCVNP